MCRSPVQKPQGDRTTLDHAPGYQPSTVYFQTLYLIGTDVRLWETIQLWEVILDVNKAVWVEKMSSRFVGCILQFGTVLQNYGATFETFEM